MINYLINRLHGGTSGPFTRGRTIRWSFAYDTVVSLLTLNRAALLRQETVRLARIPDGAMVLDVGCGTGDLALRAKAQVGERGKVYGVDAAPEMVQVAQQKAARAGVNITFQVGLIEALEFPDQTFDVVLSSLMMHHLPRDLQILGLAELRRVLRPGGTLLIVDFTTSPQRLGITQLLHHGTSSDLEDLVPLIQQTGCSELETGALVLRPLGFIRAVRPA